VVRDSKISYENKKMREMYNYEAHIDYLFSLKINKSWHKALGKNFLDEFDEFNEFLITQTAF